MSETLLLSDLIKSLPTASDATGKSVILSDTSGGLSQINKDMLFNASVGTVTSVFGNSLQQTGVYLCFAYSESNRFINCVFTVFMVKHDANKNQSPAFCLVSQGGLIVSSCNAFGTPVFGMSNGNELPSDIVLKYLRIGV